MFNIRHEHFIVRRQTYDLHGQEHHDGRDFNGLYKNDVALVDKCGCEELNR
jgi:hypothetical protein